MNVIGPESKRILQCLPATSYHTRVTASSEVDEHSFVFTHSFVTLTFMLYGNLNVRHWEICANPRNVFFLLKHLDRGLIMMSRALHMLRLCGYFLSQQTHKKRKRFVCQRRVTAIASVLITPNLNNTDFIVSLLKTPIRRIRLSPLLSTFSPIMRLPQTL